MTVLTTPQKIDDARRLTLRQMLKLELKGLSKSRGPTAYSTLKSVYGYKGTRESVLAQLDDWRTEVLQLEGESK
jgi:SH3-like domain-containing protein